MPLVQVCPLSGATPHDVCCQSAQCLWYNCPRVLRWVPAIWVLEAAFRLRLTAHCSLLTTHCSLLTAHCSLPA
eukprot:590116-Rhodomonas_salina.1